MRFLVSSKKDDFGFICLLLLLKRALERFRNDGSCTGGGCTRRRRIDVRNDVPEPIDAFRAHFEVRLSSRFLQLFQREVFITRRGRLIGVTTTSGSSTAVQIRAL